MIFEGTNDQHLFIEWIKKILACLPKNAILILDNARYHKTKDVLKTLKMKISMSYFTPHTS